MRETRREMPGSGEPHESFGGLLAGALEFGPGDGQGFVQANPARIYNYWLGGRDNFAADRRVGAAVAEPLPWVPVVARANRRFMVRAVAHLAGLGVRQFLDIGSGLPTAPNVHEVAQRILPDARVVYVDHDPAVVAHARALLVQDERTVAVEGDVRDPQALLTQPAVVGHLDWSQPVGVLLIAVLHFLSDAENPAAVVRTLRDALAPDSFLVVSHATPGAAEQAAAVQAAIMEYESTTAPFAPRSVEQVAELLAGFEVISPGLVSVDRWQIAEAPELWPFTPWSLTRPVPSWAPVHAVAAVGRRPPAHHESHP